MSKKLAVVEEDEAEDSNEGDGYIGTTAIEGKEQDENLNPPNENQEEEVNNGSFTENAASETADSAKSSIEVMSKRLSTLSTKLGGTSASSAVSKQRESIKSLKSDIASLRTSLEKNRKNSLSLRVSEGARAEDPDIISLRESLKKSHDSLNKKISVGSKSEDLGSQGKKSQEGSLVSKPETGYNSRQSLNNPTPKLSKNTSSNRSSVQERKSASATADVKTETKAKTDLKPSDARKSKIIENRGSVMVNTAVPRIELEKNTCRPSEALLLSEQSTGEGKKFRQGLSRCVRFPAHSFSTTSLMSAGHRTETHLHYKKGRLNTFQLGPSKLFSALEVKSILVKSSEAALERLQVYNEIQAVKQAIYMAKEIRQLIRQLKFERYKICVKVEIGEKRLHGCHMAARCLWDKERDSFNFHLAETPTFFILALCFGVYRD